MYKLPSYYPTKTFNDLYTFNFYLSLGKRKDKRNKFLYFLINVKSVTDYKSGNLITIITS